MSQPRNRIVVPWYCVLSFLLAVTFTVHWAAKSETADVIVLAVLVAVVVLLRVTDFQYPMPTRYGLGLARLSAYISFMLLSLATIACVFEVGAYVAVHWGLRTVAEIDAARLPVAISSVALVLGTILVSEVFFIRPQLKAMLKNQPTQSELPQDPPPSAE